MSRVYDYVVVGCGGIGSATVYWLAKKAGNRVLGLEQFNLAHHNGGSQDHSRIIRLSYNSSDYVQLARGTYEAWAEAERESGIQLVFKTGGLDIAKKGTIGAQVIENYAQAMDEQNVPYERLEGERVRRKFPQFDATPDWTCLYQKDSGLVDAAMGNAVHIQLAQKYGATIVENAAVMSLKKRGDLTQVCTSQGDFLCRKVIVTAGAWMNDVLSSVGVKIPLTVTQEQVTYFGTPHMKEFTKDRFPVFSYVYHDHSIFCVPIHGTSGVKIGIDAAGPEVGPNSRSFTPDPQREREVIDFLSRHCKRALGPILYTKTCLYAMTPDRNFVIDNCRNVGHPNVIFCCGAGHAYKFAAVLGRILSQLAIDGKTTFNIAPFNMERDAITDPNFPKCFQLGLPEEELAKLQAKL
ncbi:monomeric sarcosine oxidase-like isoform X1 [Lytechinus pictus]|uniref:monomeric sarcosine oxidase-like isoform X1 n=1 Tax=Lytechinus pictus TaxID=7653 RepID=UPI0030B9D75F